MHRLRELHIIQSKLFLRVDEMCSNITWGLSISNALIVTLYIGLQKNVPNL